MLVLDKFLGVFKNYWSKLHISRFVDTMNISKRGSHSESITNSRQNFISLVYLLGLGVEAGGVNVGVVDSVLRGATRSEATS